MSGVSVITIGSAWEYHRYCQKTYQYVEMTKEAAVECASDMIEKYTRRFVVSEWDGNGAFVDIDGGTVCMADVSIQKMQGHMYSVVVNVREDDCKLRTNSTTPSALFTQEDRRDYDDEGEGV